MSYTHSNAACFALIDCNNFYASCERLFNPKLMNQPVVVLSNNDGCVIARSNEAKRLGIRMGEPFFKIANFCRQHHIHIYSSNFALYGDISRRIMLTLSALCPEIEIYSIDEAFVRLDNIPCAPLIYAEKIRQTVWRHIGIPVSIGIAPTKTLAKVANHLAKQCRTQGIYSLQEPVVRDAALMIFPVAELWGVGRKWAERLHHLGIHSAEQLCQQPDSFLRKHFNVMMTRVVNELRGVSCLSLERVTEKQSIRYTRTFGQPISAFNELREAVTHFAARACAKARAKGYKARGVGVFIRTSYFTQQPIYSDYDVHYFNQPTHDTRQILQICYQLLGHLFCAGHVYKKAGVILFDLTPTHYYQAELFSENVTDNNGLMQLIDCIRCEPGRGRRPRASSPQ